MLGQYFPLLVALMALAILAGVTSVLRREIRRHRRELVLRSLLQEQARPLLEAARCAGCGAALSTWDGTLAPLPPRRRIGPTAGETVAYATERECLGCGRKLTIWIWSDGANWGFQEAELHG
jgi:hypothetical protein